MKSFGPERSLWENKMIDRNEFVEFCQNREAPKETFIFTVVYIAGMFCFIPFIFISEKYPLSVAAFFILFFAYLIGMPRVWFNGRHGKPKPEFIKCPECKRPLNNMNRFVVVATGNCGWCGKKILTDD